MQNRGYVISSIIAGCAVMVLASATYRELQRKHNSEAKAQGSKIVKTDFYVADFGECKIWPTTADVNLTPQIVLGNQYSEYQVLIETAIIKKIGRIEEGGNGYHSTCSDRWIVYQFPKS